MAARTATIKATGGPQEARHIRRSVAGLLKLYLKWRHGLPKNSPALFVSAAGKRITARHFNRRLRHWAEKAGLSCHVTPHVFGHTLASRLLALTGNLRLVQQALGPRSIASTVRYTQVPTEALRAAP